MEHRRDGWYEELLAFLRLPAVNLQQSARISSTVILPIGIFSRAVTSSSRTFSLPHNGDIPDSPQKPMTRFCVGRSGSA